MSEVVIFLFVLACSCSGGCASAAGWKTEEWEVFDVVEEVNQNFYTLLDVPQDANHTQIKKAFRRLSLILHPDKNDAPDAEIRFRQLVAVYDVLKDVNKRKCYDHVLEHGLPDWKDPAYYYRRVRKMGLLEMSIILFVIITVGQYLVGWAQYLEHKFNVDEYVSMRTKKHRKKLKKGVKSDAMSAEMSVLPPELDPENYKPSVRNTLPFQLPRLVWFLLVDVPPLTYRLVQHYWSQRPTAADSDQQECCQEESTVATVRGPRRRKAGFTVPELSGDHDAATASVAAAAVRSDDNVTSGRPPLVTGGLWTDDDLSDLARLMKKYPVGTTERWQKIADTLNRPSAEVAHMAHKMKDNLIRSLANQGHDHRRRSDHEKSDGDDEDEAGAIENGGLQVGVVATEERRKVKTRGSNEVAQTQQNWSQTQQKALEAALAKHPKSGANDRWEKIANCVPGKTKEECMLRYKHLVDMVRKKKEVESDAQPPVTLDCPSSTSTSTVRDGEGEDGQ